MQSMAVVDNNVLSSLAKIDRLELLPAVFETTGTPPAVLDELGRAEAAGYDFVEQINAVKAHNDGWLAIIAPTEAEFERANEIQDHALSTTDARCLAIASCRNCRLVTDDAHVGTIGRQQDVAVWDLVLFLQAAVRTGAISTAEDLSAIIDALHRRDGYRFSSADEDALFASLRA